MMEHDLVTCRRVNYIQAAMVQAAIAIQHQHGTQAATAILQAEQLPQEVIDRVLTAGTARRLQPYTALEKPASLLPD